MEEIKQYLAQRNGYDQDIFLLEEMAELQKELLKHRRGRDNRNQIIDECVDVLLTIDILLRVYNATDDEINNLMEYKLYRLRDFIPKER